MPARAIGLSKLDTKTTRKALRMMGDEAEQEMREASAEIARFVAAQMHGDDPLSRKVADTVRARAGKTPAVVAGGARRVAVSGQPSAGDVYFGSEFGGGRRRTTQQFRGHQSDGYWFWPTMRRLTPAADRAWARAFLDVLDAWERVPDAR